MQLLQTWKESLSLFLPQNLKLFSLVTLKAVIQTYKTWFCYFGWAIALFLCIDGMFPALHAPGFIFASPFSLALSSGMILRLIGWSLLLFSLYLTVRPSLLKKTFKYFIGYAKYFIYFFLISLIITWVNLLFLFLMYSGSPTHAYGMGMSALLIFIGMFLLDSDGRFVSTEYSIFRGFKMFIYNYPFCVIVGIFFMAFMHLGAKLFVMGALALVKLLAPTAISTDPVFALEFAERIFYLLALPIPVCFIANYYIKKVHDQFTLYF